MISCTVPEMMSDTADKVPADAALPSAGYAGRGGQ